jgi:hypothetical protein
MGAPQKGQSTASSSSTDCLQLGQTANSMAKVFQSLATPQILAEPTGFLMGVAGDVNQ